MDYLAEVLSALGILVAVSQSSASGYNDLNRSGKLTGQVGTCRSVIGWSYAEWVEHPTDVGVGLGDCAAAADAAAGPADVGKAKSEIGDWAVGAGQAPPWAWAYSGVAELAVSCVAGEGWQFGVGPASVVEVELGAVLEQCDAD